MRTREREKEKEKEKGREGKEMILPIFMPFIFLSSNLLGTTLSFLFSVVRARDSLVQAQRRIGERVEPEENFLRDGCTRVTTRWEREAEIFD